ncbi:SPOR domain-containing protein [Aliidiomarina sp. Khilg15.8]
MSVDYADKGKPAKRKAPKKGRPPGRSQQASRRGKKPQPGPARWKLILLALVIVGLFVAALWFLNTSSSDDEDAGGEASAEPVIFTESASQPETEDALPQAPQERWQYIHELENREVEVIVPERKESARRLMQCGSFRRENDAQSLRAQIAMQGMEAQVRRTVSEQHGAWYRVILGPFDNLRAAQSANNQLRRANIHGCQIWLWNLD